ncbi:symbiotic chitinase [Stachybotrys elegans]|uniref:chitinase n=1 Tax=Stachybotrys elegans TaxID=80388 RepID=A0A8K0WQ41_9HYPO|nr:symbiotic chitinase [Stachybotrys elegans]
MRPYCYLPFVLALVVSTAAELSSSEPTVHRRFSSLERRALAYQDAAVALHKREDFTCGPGKDGWCGYGPTYCGDGCTSNCDAHAECGQYAVPKDKKCPLNTCCSEHGFCGTTKDFCTGKCQSNCVEHPKPPGGGGKTLDKVIGYYEAWNDRSKCHQTKASDLPIDGLTHLNYAFAYIDPQSFQITTMDAATPAKTFQDVADLKTSNPNLQLYVSLGGWTFSDNGTATQPVFGDIARSSSNRDKFASNLLKFLDTYGYDGVDLDWEYPGAPDRGGKKDDTENYIGLTFTAPSSFWYLRWFDLPGMIKHVDWINIMSYDLHGVWDSSNPIGSIVQGHTNLTEIKLAAELFWRVDIPPSKLALGFGFYGRAFTLADPGCTTPGCRFASGAKPGVCTGTSGYLAHYEIQDIIGKNKKRGITPVHDKEAAVKYMTWDNDQWISYDDHETFEQKIKWADDIGFSGSLIWASDLDDYEFSAHKALTGNTNLKSAAKKLVEQGPVSVADVDTSLGGKCYKTDSRTGFCKEGFTKVGSDWDGEKCSKKDQTRCGKAICCPNGHSMGECTWRGSGGDCNGRCHDGEVKVSGSSWGGSPGESSGESRCSRGGKAFCCKATQFDSLTEHCRWTESCTDNQCKSDEQEVAYAWDRGGYATIFCNGYRYCCKKDRPMPLQQCHWVGKGDCAQNSCAQTEVTLYTNNFGDTDGSRACNWWRHKSLCCTPNSDALEEDICDVDICADDETDCYDGLGDESSSLARRSHYNELEARTRNRPGSRRKIDLLLSSGAVLTWWSRPYPTGDKRDYLFRSGTGLATMLLKGGYDSPDNVCTNAALTFLKVSELPRKFFQTEHFFEVQWPKVFLETCVTGLLPGVLGKLPMQAAMLAEANLLAGWNKAYAAGIALNSFYEVVSGMDPSWVAPLNTPADRLMTALGDWGNMRNMFLIKGDVNWVKGQLFSLNNPMAADKRKKYVTEALKGTVKSAQKIEIVIKNVFAAFNYMNDGITEIVEDETMRAITKEIQNMEDHMPELRGIKAIFDEFMPVYKEAVVQKARMFVLDMNNYVTFNVPASVAAQSAHLQRLLHTCSYYANKVSDLKWQKS